MVRGWCFRRVRAELREWNIVIVVYIVSVRREEDLRLDWLRNALGTAWCGCCRGLCVLIVFAIYIAGRIVAVAFKR